MGSERSFSFEQSTQAYVVINRNAEQIFNQFWKAKNEMENFKNWFNGYRANLIIESWNKNVSDVVFWLNSVMTILPDMLAGFIEDYAIADNSNIRVNKNVNRSIKSYDVDKINNENVFVFSSDMCDTKIKKIGTALDNCIEYIKDINTSVENIEWNDLVGDSYRKTVFEKCNNAINAIGTLKSEIIDNGISAMKSDLEKAEENNSNIIKSFSM